MYVGDFPQKYSTIYTNRDSRNEGCGSFRPRSATESLRDLVVVGHDEEGPREEQRKAKVSPRGHG